MTVKNGAVHYSLMRRKQGEEKGGCRAMWIRTFTGDAGLHDRLARLCFQRNFLIGVDVVLITLFHLANFSRRMAAWRATLKRSDNENIALDNRDHFYSRATRRYRRAEADFLKEQRSAGYRG
jgi:hypothetical protein